MAQITVNGERVRQVRELHGWTQREFADRIGVDQPVVAMLENGRRQPTDNVLAAIVEHSGFPKSHFLREDPQDFPLGSLLFRGPQETVKQQNMAHRYAQIIFETIGTLRSRLNTIPLRVPRLIGQDPVSAAQLARSSFGLSPDGPIDNLTLVLERCGVIVIAVPAEIEGRDAFSGWAFNASVPVVAVSAGKPTDRLRWSVAHELGHLVMHQAFSGRLAEVEDQADQFAAEFLMPAESIRPQLVAPLTLAGLTALKLRWKVAIQALIRRAYELEVIARHQYDYLFKQLTLRGWRTREPVNLDPPPEVPRTMPEMIRTVFGTKAQVASVAASSQIGVDFLSSVLKAHATDSFLPPKAPHRGRSLAIVRGRKGSVKRHASPREG